MNNKSLEEIFDYKNKTIFLDVDGTIIADGEEEINRDVLEKIKNFSQKNDVYLCSNKSLTRAQKFSKLIGCKYILGKKPFTRGFREIFKIKNPDDIFVVGDKYLTDGLLAKFLGAKFIKVTRRLSPNDSFFIKISYILDDFASVLLPYLILIRPWQWVKNLLVFAPLFFAVYILNFSLVKEASLVFLIFCLSSGLVYIFNDILDYKQDRLHPKKKYRPLAAQEISIKNSIIFSIFLLVIIVWLISYIKVIIFPVFLYIILNIFYSLRLKHIIILDIILIPIFYLLRIIAGGLGGKIYISPWIIICVFFGSLFIIISKRRSEYAQEEKRFVLKDYSIQALDFMLAVSSSLAIMSYGIWSVIEHNSSYLVYSTVFVVFIFLRILNRIYTHPHETEVPEILVFKDKWILGAFIFWLFYMFFLFYYFII